MSNRALPWSERTKGECREHGTTLVPACSECFTCYGERLSALRAEYEAKLATFGMVELAVRNPNVSSYITEWEGRALSAEAKLASERKHADELYAALDEVMTFTLEDFPDMDARHPKACVTPAYRAANVAGVDVLRAHAARRKEEAK